MKNQANKAITLLFILFSCLAFAEEEVSPTTVKGATTINASKAKALFDQEVAFVDVRKNSDWEAGRIPSAIHLELKKVYTADSLAEEVEKNEAVVLYCNGPKCMRSSKASAKAVEWGFSKVYYFRDGFPAWKAAGYPVE
ncbi:MAG: rhodanese-like domain-containing protein [Pseudomonadales bacterium]|nr:rhodanese-like domain-containing protein [Pseudomonadales bacterium]